MRWAEGVLKCAFILTSPCERGLDSMVTCRTVRQRTCLAANSSELQQAMNWATQPVGRRVSLLFTLSTRLAFNTYALVEVAFEPLFLKAGVSKYFFLPRWAPAAEMPCGEGDPRNGSSLEEESYFRDLDFDYQNYTCLVSLRIHCSRGGIIPFC